MYESRVNSTKTTERRKWVDEEVENVKKDHSDSNSEWAILDRRLPVVNGVELAISALQLESLDRSYVQEQTMGFLADPQHSFYPR